MQSFGFSVNSLSDLVLLLFTMIYCNTVIIIVVKNCQIWLCYGFVKVVYDRKGNMSKCYTTQHRKNFVKLVHYQDFNFINFNYITLLYKFI